MRRRVVLSVAAAAALTTTAAMLGPAAHGSAGAARSTADVTRTDGVLSGRLTGLAAVGAPAARALSVPVDGAGAVVSADDGRVLVQVLLRDTSTGTIDSLRRVATVINVAHSMSRATLLIAPARLAGLATLPAVTYADLVPAPVHGAASDAAGSTVPAVGTADPPEAARRCDPRRSEADSQLRAAAARRESGIDGSGVTVGALSDSFDRDPVAITFASEDVRSGDLPGPGNPCGRTTSVRVLSDYDDGGQPTDEGRAMLQAVHDLAPGAGLAFAPAGGGPDVFADNIVALQHAGADVIVDDFTYFTEPFFQAGVLDRAVSTVTERGVTYVSSAGNSNAVLGGRDVSSWETPAVRLGTCPDLGLDPVDYGPIGTCVQFDPAGSDTGYGVRVAPGGTLTPVMQWAEPYYGVTDDFDLFLVDAATHQILASSTAVQTSSRTPVEYLSWTNSGTAARNIDIVVNRFSGNATPRLKLAFVTMTGLVSVEHDRSQGGDIVGPTVFGHNGGPDTLSVAAVPYDDATTVEPYSSRGPVTHYFGPVRGTRAASRLTHPVSIAAPQVGATDGYGTTFFGDKADGTYRFYGTSAAAPAAAAVAALVRAANPGLAPARVRAVLAQTAHAVPHASPDAVGSGLVDAEAAVALVRPAGPPTLTRTKTPKKSAGSAKVWFRPGAVVPTAAIVGYDTRCRSSDGGTTATAARPGTSLAPLVVTGLSGGHTYRCGIRARTAYGPGAWSADGSQVVARGRPGKPKHVKAHSVRRAASFSFRAPRNTGGMKLTGYIGSCVAGGRVRTATAGASATAITIRLHAGEKYRCQVRATNKLGAGKPSHRVRVRV